MYTCVFVFIINLQKVFKYCLGQVIETRRTDLWTQRGQEGVRRIERVALSYTHDGKWSRERMGSRVTQGAQPGALTTQRAGTGRGGAREEVQDRGRCVNLQLVHVNVRGKPTQHSEAIILQLKMN